MTKPKRAPRPYVKAISKKTAFDYMRNGSRLVHMYQPAKEEKEYFVIPGGVVTDTVAEEIKKHPCVIGQQDGLFPGHDQTWRMSL